MQAWGKPLFHWRLASAFADALKLKVSPCFHIDRCIIPSVRANPWAAVRSSVRIPSGSGFRLHRFAARGRLESVRNADSPCRVCSLSRRAVCTTLPGNSVFSSTAGSFFCFCGTPAPLFVRVYLCWKHGRLLPAIGVPG